MKINYDFRISFLAVQWYKNGSLTS